MSEILVDTHVLVWLTSAPRSLSRNASRAIRKAAASGGISVASITLWELAMLLTRGRIRIPGTVESGVRELVETPGASVLPVTPAIAAIAAQLPDSVGRDPADRLIAATAIAHGRPLVTHDEHLLASPVVPTVW